MTERPSAGVGSGAEIELRFERAFKAPLERVFAAFTDRAQLMRWWGPDGYSCPDCEMDVRPGGRWRTSMLSPQGQKIWVSGVYVEIVPNKRLAFTWAWEENGVRGHETVVTLDFQPSNAGTRVLLVQRGFASTESRDQHRQGWTSTFNCLDRALVSAKSG